MEELNSFVNDLLKILNKDSINEVSDEQAREIVYELNKFLYTNYEGIGNIEVIVGENKNNCEYVSDYHKFWEKNYEKILEPKINEEKCNMVAQKLHEVYLKEKNVFYKLYEIGNLNKEEICKIRYYSAIQEFNGSRKLSDFVKAYREDKSIFDKEKIKANPNDFISRLDLAKLSQSDKRKKYAEKAADFLIELKCEPYDLIEKFNWDVVELRKKLMNGQMGFGLKKVDMFIRDMVVLNVWKKEKCKNFDQINVASDINTMKVALRTGILSTKIPLVSSFLDIYDYQYGLLDRVTQEAWKKVWEKWKDINIDECIEEPCFMDHYIYNVIGKKFCNNQSGGLCKYKELECPFKSICHSNDSEYRKLNGPKAISIFGQTGWNTAYVRKDEGGGGLRA